ncbi:hypothetical protein CGRA01v4_05415 [Colletotrichum graminicola]|nr:hypothetical protein CGRA01v4_05415 [Colletotrichum graminicola]
MSHCRLGPWTAAMHRTQHDVVIRTIAMPLLPHAIEGMLECEFPGSRRLPSGLAMICPL